VKFDVGIKHLECVQINNFLFVMQAKNGKIQRREEKQVSYQ
jgi:hypothetical protein